MNIQFNSQYFKLIPYLADPVLILDTNMPTLCWANGELLFENLDNEIAFNFDVAKLQIAIVKNGTLVQCVNGSFFKIESNKFIISIRALVDLNVNEEVLFITARSVEEIKKYSSEGFVALQNLPNINYTSLDYGEVNVMISGSFQFNQILSLLRLYCEKECDVEVSSSSSNVQILPNSSVSEIIHCEANTSTIFSVIIKAINVNPSTTINFKVKNSGLFSPIFIHLL